MATSLANRTPLRVSEKEENALRLLDAFLNISGAPVARLVGPDRGELELPAAVFEALRRAVHLLAQGQAVTIVPYDKMLTTQEAAEILNVSRPHLVKMLTEHVIPYVRIGTHRRIRYDDLMRYRVLRDSQRKEGLKRLTELSEELGLYDTGEELGKELGK